jgi:AcrR family transcriptional regulator
MTAQARPAGPAAPAAPTGPAAHAALAGPAAHAAPAGAATQAALAGATTQAAPAGPVAQAAPPVAAAPAESTPRRQRLRAATELEIRATARRVLVEHGAEGLTLRAIAREMGMTAPALYRYFPSREDLLEHLVSDLYGEVCAELAAARDAAPGDDAGAPVLAVSRTFRSWALDHPGEFGLLFGSPIGDPGPGDAGTKGPAHEASMRFALLFGELVARLWERRPFPARADGEIDAGLADQLRGWSEDLPLGLPLGVLQVFLSCWIRLYGAVCMEAFGHLRFAVEDAGAIFEAELRSLAGLLGAEDLYRPPARPPNPAPILTLRTATRRAGPS